MDRRRVARGSVMVIFDQWKFPDGELHLPRRMRKWDLRVAGRLTYQYPLYELAMKQCRKRRVAVDVGAHVGLLSFWMVRDFGQVVAFEPVEAHRDCWRANVPAREQDLLYDCALGAAPGLVRLEGTEGSSGGTRVAGQGEIHMRTLDSFALPIIDLLKVDCEGYEVEVLTGAVETLRRCRPIVAVEQRAKQVASFGHGPTDAVQILMKLGARTVWTDRSDYVLAF